MTAFVEGWRAAELRVFLMCYDAVLARVLAAVGKHDAALERADIALELAEETGMHFYDAELLRVRALTCDAPEARRAGLMEAIELARRQDAVIFELRAAADYFTQFGDNEALTSVADRMPAGQSWPELARARALLA
jgi:predicted ATPase